MQTRHEFHEELAALDRQLLEMGTAAERMVGSAVSALRGGDVPLAESVLDQDDAVDEMNRDIEARCMRLLALQQPMARDLRLIGTALKVITDVERIGDHAVDIAKIARRFTQQLHGSRPLVDVGPLAEMAQSLLRRSLEALVQRDADLAARVVAEDDQIDETFQSLRDALFSFAGSSTAPAAYTLLAMVYLERIADHAVNIAERVSYVETGHLGPLTPPSENG
ncbi:MAG: phosphate signaling complex protein PhoU [Armatimonadetes bacterium]|nr:phosphate signaling complex protein PhoU [Armatimonadota bacterium]